MALYSSVKYTLSKVIKLFGIVCDLQGIIEMCRDSSEVDFVSSSKFSRKITYLGIERSQSLTGNREFSEWE